MATMTLSDMSFSSYAGKVALLITSSGTYTFDNCTWDLSGTYEIEIDSGVTGDTVINLQNGTTAITLSDVDNNGSGNVTINNNKTITIQVNTLSDGVAIVGARVLLLAGLGGDLPSDDSVSIVGSGTTATVTHTSHGMATGQKIQIKGVTQIEYNGIHTITVTTANAYTYTMSGSPSSPALGSPKCTAVILSDVTDGTGELEITTFNYTTSQPVVGRVRKTTTAPFYKTGPITGTISSAGFSAIILLALDQ